MGIYNGQTDQPHRCYHGDRLIGNNNVNNTSLQIGDVPTYDS